MIQKIEILIEFVQCCEPRNNAKSWQFGFSLLLLCSDTNINQIFLLVSYNTCWPHNWISSYVITSSVVEAAEYNERTLSSIRARITMKSAKKLIISIWMKNIILRRNKGRWRYSPSLYEFVWGICWVAWPGRGFRCGVLSRNCAGVDVIRTHLQWSSVNAIKSVLNFVFTDKSIEHKSTEYIEEKS